MTSDTACVGLTQQPAGLGCVLREPLTSLAVGQDCFSDQGAQSRSAEKWRGCLLPPCAAGSASSLRDAAGDTVLRLRSVLTLCTHVSRVPGVSSSLGFGVAL